jgi:hypothetical protein
MTTIPNVKITVVGDACGNKTQLTKTFQTNSLYLDNILGEASFSKTIDLDGRKLNLNIHDISRQEGKDYVTLLSNRSFSFLLCRI